MTKVSVIVPVYNGERYIESCISSLRTQTMQAFEVILVNDGSTDGSLSVMERVFAQNPGMRIRILNKKNGGLSEARNFGFAAAFGEYIYFLDVDDWLAPDALEKVTAAGEMYRADIVTLNSVNVQERACPKAGTGEVDASQILYSHYRRRSLPAVCMRGETFVIESLLSEEGFFPPVWLNCYRRSFLVDNHLSFVHMIHEDLVYSIDACLAAGSVVCLNEVLHFRRVVPSSITNGKKTENHIEGILRAVRHADMLYQQYRGDSCKRKAFRKWNLLNAWQLYTELKQCSKEIQKRYKWICLRYILVHPHMGNPVMIAKLLSL